MLLVADSGGTKTDWLAGDGVSRPESLQTRGLNPNIAREDEIRDTLRTEVKPWLKAAAISAVYFFGAGLGSERNRSLVQTIIERELKVKSVRVYPDVLGAAYAGLGRNKGVVGVLGTGSVAVRYDGREIQKRCGGLGFLLGDEGSGVALGKALLRLYLENRLPLRISRIYAEFVGPDRGEVLRELYSGNPPTDFLARQAFFLARCREDPWTREFLSCQFELFFRSTLEPCLKEAGDIVVFAGGVAENFFSILSRVCRERGVKRISLLKSPMVAPLLAHILDLERPTSFFAFPKI